MKSRMKVFLTLVFAFLALLAFGLGRYWNVDNPPFMFSFPLGFLAGAVTVQGFWKLHLRLKEKADERIRD